jgi:hypothetical protein
MKMESEMGQLPIDVTPKKRKKRKPMTAEQKAAAAERLAKAREERAKKNPPEYKNVADNILALDDEHALSLPSIKRYIKTSQEKLTAARANMRSKETKIANKAIAEVNSLQGYIRNLQTYLRTGTYTDMFYGEHQQNRMKNVCIKMAYDMDGNPKRNIGTFYPDINAEWTKEMDTEYRLELSKFKKKK